MKKQTALMIIIVLFVVTASAISAFAQARQVVADIPFNFTIRERALPAGRYNIEPVRVGGSDALRIQSADGRITVTVFARAERAESDEAGPQLIFNRYGNQYFLGQVFGFEQGSMHELSRSKSEDRLAKSANAVNRVTVQASKTR